MKPETTAQRQRRQIAENFKKAQDIRESLLEDVTTRVVDACVKCMDREGKRAIAEERPASKLNASKLAKEKVLEILSEYLIHENPSK